MRTLEDVTEKNTREITSFAARALASENVSIEGHAEIRLAAQKLKEVVKSAIITNNESRRQPIRTARRRRQPKNHEIIDQIQARQARKEESSVRS